MYLTAQLTDKVSDGIGALGQVWVVEAGQLEIFMGFLEAANFEEFDSAWEPQHLFLQSLTLLRDLAVLLLHRVAQDIVHDLKEKFDTFLDIPSTLWDL